MSDRMNKADLLEWIERWALVNERQREEAARKTPAEKFLELGHLMAAADMFRCRAESRQMTKLASCGFDCSAG